MKKDTIVQFVCFVTDIELDEFLPRWERYAKRLINNRAEMTLQQAEKKSRFRYISQHEWKDSDFQFTFINEKKSEHFPEQKVRVVQAGGYMPIQVKRRRNEENGDTKLIAFIGHDERDIDFYRNLPLYNHLNIHEAYYESCTYGYVLEFFVTEINVDELLYQLKQRPGVETGVYKECLGQHV
jgi:hypothetical protein